MIPSGTYSELQPLTQPNLRYLYVSSLRDLTYPYLGQPGLDHYHGELKQTYIEILQLKIYGKWRYEKWAYPQEVGIFRPIILYLRSTLNADSENISIDYYSTRPVFEAIAEYLTRTLVGHKQKLQPSQKSRCRVNHIILVFVFYFS